MRPVLSVVIAVLVGCGGAQAGTTASPESPQASAQPATASQRQPVEPDACQSADPTAPVAVGLSSKFTARDVAEWYIDVTCRTVVIPREALGRASGKAVSEQIQRTQVDDMFASLLTELGLSQIADGDLVVVIDRATTEIAGRPRTAAKVVITPALDPVNRRPASLLQGSLDDQLERGIRKVNDLHYQIYRAVWHGLWDAPEKTARGARIVPSVKNGVANGFKLYAIRPSSLFARIGFRNGDTVHAINGTKLTTPDKVFEVVPKLKSADRVTFDLTRRGKPLVLLLEIVDTAP